MELLGIEPLDNKTYTITALMDDNITDLTANEETVINIWGTTASDTILDQLGQQNNYNVTTKGTVITEAKLILKQDDSNWKVLDKIVKNPQKQWI